MNKPMETMSCHQCGEPFPIDKRTSCACFKPATEELLSVDQRRLVRLLARFRRFSSARRDVAEGWRERGESRVASESDKIADHYDRCADELERTINGEMPADPGCDWPICETNDTALLRE
jgi:hypothetical protein